VQADVEQIHRQECRCQHERDGNGHHHAGPDAQADEGDEHHHSDSFGQRLDEGLYGTLDGIRLAGRLADLDADGQAGLQA
jgi:hypothetical protein